MFEIDPLHRTDSYLPIIIDNYKVLHYDEFPILFSGTNKYGNKLIGSFSYEDDENDLFRYFTILVDDKQFSDFFNKKCSYRDLIKSNKELFILDKDINNNISSIYLLPIEGIPSEYLPYPSSFIPEQKAVVNSLNFAFSLKGKLADIHKAIVSDINSVNQRIYNYLEESLDALNGLLIQPVIYSQPSQVGSYRLNFDIEFTTIGQASLFPINQEKVSEFINGYLNYVACKLPNEDDNFLQNESRNSLAFLAVMKSFESMFIDSDLKPLSASTEILIDSINNSANKLSEITEFLKDNDSFNAIELGNYDENGVISTIGYLMKDYKESVSSKLLPIEEPSATDVVTSDAKSNSYRILVYKLNRYTGKGLAKLYYDAENFYKVRLNIELNGKELSNSPFTKSMDEDKVVDIQGIGTKINGIYKKLECYL